MSGHLEAAAAALIAASQAVPVEHTQGAISQIDTVVAAIQQTGGGLAQELTQVALSIKTEIESSTGRLVQLREQLDAAASMVLRGGN